MDKRRYRWLALAVRLSVTTGRQDGRDSTHHVSDLCIFFYSQYFPMCSMHTLYRYRLKEPSFHSPDRLQLSIRISIAWQWHCFYGSWFVTTFSHSLSSPRNHSFRPTPLPPAVSPSILFFCEAHDSVSVQ